MLPPDPGRVDVVTFDSYGTLVDTDSARRVLEGLVEDPGAVARDWRRRALFYSVVAGDLGAYATYYELHRDGLRDALAAVGIEVGETDLEALVDVYHDLEPYPGVEKAFERLAAAGYRPSVLSNGDPAMLESLVATLGVEDSVDELVSAHEIRTLKPDTALYEHAADRLGVPTARVVHVTAHWMDVMGADHAGMRGVHLDRAGGGWPSFGPEPTATVGSLAALCTRLGV
jgi:2-haloacid dehalogenase